MSGRETSGSRGGVEPELTRHRLLDAGGPVEDDETARQKMRDAKVYARGVVNTRGEYAGFDPDNVGDVKSAAHRDEGSPATNAVKPMGHFALMGDLPMMWWLYDNGANTRDEDVAVHFPMRLAAMCGHLEACKWLVDHGAAADIKRRTREECGQSPLSSSFGGTWKPESCRNVSRWLILNGALCQGDEDMDSSFVKSELLPRHLDFDYPGVVQNHINRREKKRRDREGKRRDREGKRLLKWALSLHQKHSLFLVFLSGVRPSSDAEGDNTHRIFSPLQCFGGKPGVLQLIGDFAGVVRSREAPIIRKLTELLPAIFLSRSGKWLWSWGKEEEWYGLDIMYNDFLRTGLVHHLPVHSGEFILDTNDYSPDPLIGGSGLYI